ncbi:M56 family metallopeptidase [Virgibacillus halodenitrificans]|uniref:M56 family metallopeptidase n=1 Tax=Virgibacillus halodenitrificans TaxID=1482 RepID=UPI000EF4E50C|nr:M56 family metallopeptidase [Virgibacillus halodenitrificans]
MPQAMTIISYIVLTGMIAFISFILPKRIGKLFEISVILGFLIYLFLTYEITEALMLISLCAFVYGSLLVIFDRDKQAKQRQLKEELKQSSYKKIQQEKDVRRLTLDIFFVLLVSSIGLLFIFYAPETYALLKFFIGIYFILTITQFISRVTNYVTAELYFLPEQNRLIIMSALEPRDLPLEEVQEVRRETGPDLLRLHPLFTFMSENVDYTISFNSVLRLSFPGETIYINFDLKSNIFKQLIKCMKKDTEQKEKKVVALWHPDNLKRLFWKGYYAITVKGVSAYTGLLFILIWLDAPSSVMISFVLLWWVFNLYISDRVLVAASDGKELTEGKLFNEAQQLFKQAGISKTRLYLVDSPIHNGLATGMNLGRGTIMLTSATAQLSLNTIKAIIAHEAIHIKKRDILSNQIARMLFFAVIAAGSYLFYDQLLMLTEHIVFLTILIYFLMILFPVYLSFIAQWTEMRADYLGSLLLDKQGSQMANGLYELGKAQDEAVKKKLSYSTQGANSVKRKLSTEREGWFMRFIEFQFMVHPPLYWRIYSLRMYNSWRSTLTGWAGARLKESLPDFFRKSIHCNEQNTKEVNVWK